MLIINNFLLAAAIHAIPSRLFRRDVVGIHDNVFTSQSEHVYILQKVLGQGSHGTVYLGHSDTNDIAVKSILLTSSIPIWSESCTIADLQQYQCEIIVLRALGRLVENELCQFINPKSINLVFGTQLFFGHTLPEFLKQFPDYSKSRLDEIHDAGFLALKALHEKGIYHGDVLMNNMLISLEGNVIAVEWVDNGSSKMVGREGICGIGADMLEDEDMRFERAFSMKAKMLVGMNQMMGGRA